LSHFQEIFDALSARHKYQADERRRQEIAAWRSSDGQSWYAVRVAPQKEFTLGGRHDASGEWFPGVLERKGYSQVFVPTETKFRKTLHKGRRVSIPVLYPLFTSYIFVGGAFSWQHLLTENHVQGVVGFPDEHGNRRPAPISESEMDKLRAMSGGLVPHRRSVNPHRAWRVGEKAEIAVGPYQGQITDIVGLHGRWAEIFVNLFGSRRLVTILSEHLEAA
jgi:transcription antitermination factor NusG